MHKRADRPVSVPTSVGPGTVLSDRFRLVKPIGSGGMAVVWRAEHLTLGIPVALKMLRPVDVHSSVARARFLQEARVVAAIRHPNVVQVLEYGMHGDLPYLAMELLEGEPLSKRLQRVGTLDVKTTVWLVEQVARPIDKAHAKGIVHRDIKPDNIFLTSTEEGEVVKLVDFGIAKLLDGGVPGETITRTGAIIGTTHYLSPERARGKKPIDGGVDLWALAVVVYECILGRRPFDDHSDDLLALLKAIASADYLPPSMLGDVSPEFDAWVDQALNANPDARFPSAMAMVRALREAMLPGTVPSDTGSTVDAIGDDSFHDLDEEETFHFEPVGPVSQVIVGGASVQLEDPSSAPFPSIDDALASAPLRSIDDALTSTPLPSMDDVPDLPAFSDVDEQVVNQPDPLGPQLRRFDLAIESHSVPVVPSPEPAAFALLDDVPQAPIPDLFTTPVEQSPEPLAQKVVPVAVEPAPVTVDAPHPGARTVSTRPPAPHRDWRVLAMAAAALVVASVIGVTAVRLFSRRATPPVGSPVESVAMSPALTASAPTIVADVAASPAIPVSALPPANSVATPVWDVERLPVQEPSAPSPSVPAGPPPRPRNPGPPGTGRNPHEVFGL